jgi:peptidyl-prolyl cis-trans isomerase C
MTRPLLPPVFVHGVEIPPAAIAAEAQNHPAPPGKPGLAWRAAARALALREALLHEARARGLAAAPQELAPGQWETEEEALIRALLDLAVQPEPTDEAALRSHYDTHRDAFRAPDLWQVSHILIAAPPGPGRDAARARVESLAALLTLDPGRFADVARQDSACSSRAAGGSLGQICPGDTVPEFDAALRRLTPGQITREPVETRFGFHLIRLDAAAQGSILPYEVVAPRLRDAAQKTAWARAARDFAQGLLERPGIIGLGTGKDGE